MHSSKVSITRWIVILMVALLGSVLGDPTAAPSGPEETPPPTNMPSYAPSDMPSAGPTQEPTLGSTAMATPPPTTAAPSSMPSDGETEPPTGVPTTLSPTISPTEPQVTPAPTEGPTVSPMPSLSPSLTPTATDTTPSAAPSITPTEEQPPPPSISPSEIPSYSPSEMPSGLDTTTSPAPSLAPTVNNGTTSPPSTLPPTATKTDSFKGLKMRLIGLTKEFSNDDSQLWERETVAFVVTFWTSTRRRLQTTPPVPMTTEITVDNSALAGATVLEVTYNQDVTYPQSENVNAEDLVTQPFATPESRERYAQALQAAGFNDLQSTDAVKVPDQDGGGDDDGGLSTGAIIGIACGGAAGLALLGGGAYYLAKRNKSSSGGGGGYLKSDADDIPPSQLQLSGIGPDEVSTLEDPKTRSGLASGDELTGYGDQSVATVDYDYSKAYGGAGDTSVSSAGGTFGSNTHGQASTAAGLGAGAALAGGVASYSDDESFDAQYRSDKREEVIDVYAPAGKLGVVIDTPDDGAPVVHAIKDSSVIADKLQVGDKLIAVDDEDVRSMTAIKVSKLISRKSGNNTRKLTVVRAISE